MYVISMSLDLFFTTCLYYLHVCRVSHGIYPLQLTMHSARYDWALDAWERGLAVSLKHVCLRGWASVIEADRRETDETNEHPQGLPLYL